MRRYRRGLFCAALLAVIVARAPSAEAAGHSGSVAILGLEPVDVPETVTQSVTDALRQRATAGGLRVVAAKDFVELKMVFNCDGESPSCMAQAGKSLGADLLVYGSVKRGNKGDVQVTLKLLDVASGAVQQFINESLPLAALEGVSLKSTTTRWFGSLFGIEAKGKLNVVTDPAGASVSIDGQAVGEAPLDIADLSVGPHVLVLSKSGYLDVRQTVSVAADDTVVARAQLAPDPALAPQPGLVPLNNNPQPVAQPTGHPGRTAKFVGLGAGVAAIVAAGVAIYTWRSYSNLESTAHNDLIAAQPSSTAPSSFFRSPSCSVPAGFTSTPAGQKYKNDCDSGNSFANATTALWVVAGVLAAGGVASYIVGDRQAAHAREQQRGSVVQLLKQTLRIAPIATSNSGGISASFEF